MSIHILLTRGSPAGPAATSTHSRTRKCEWQSSAPPTRAHTVQTHLATERLCYWQPEDNTDTPSNRQASYMTFSYFTMVFIPTIEINDPIIMKHRLCITDFCLLAQIYISKECTF